MISKIELSAPPRTAEILAAFTCTAGGFTALSPEERRRVLNALCVTFDIWPTEPTERY